MRFKVPQFIEVEDKIFGPLTAKQFIYLAGSAGVVVALNAFFPLYLTVLIGGPVAALGLALAFYKKDGRSFIFVLESAFYFFVRDKLYLWKHRQADQKKKAAGKETATIVAPQLSQNKLKDLAWSLDIKEHMYTPTKDDVSQK